MYKFIANLKRAYIILCILTASVSFAQKSPENTNSSTESTNELDRKIEPKIIDRGGLYYVDKESRVLTDLPLGFSNIELGISFEMVKQAIAENDYFQSFEEPDIYTVPQGVDRVILVYGFLDERTNYQFIREAYFQFNEDDELISISLYLNPDILDYFTVYYSHERKYGDPDMLNPQKAEWMNADVTLTIEKPLSIKYVRNPDAQKTEKKFDYVIEREKQYEDFLSSF